MMYIHPEAPQLHVYIYICLRGLLQAVSMVDDDNFFPTVTGSWVLGPGAAPGCRLEAGAHKQTSGPCPMLGASGCICSRANTISPVLSPSQVWDGLTQSYFHLGFAQLFAFIFGYFLIACIS